MKNLRLFILIISYLLTSAIYAQDIICLKSGIEGKDHLKQVGDKVIGRTITSNYNEMEVYVTFERDQIYCQSNYLIPEQGIQYPTKLSYNIEEIGFDMEMITASLTEAIIESPKFNYQNFSQAFAKDIKFLVDHKIFESPRFKKLDFGGAENVYLITNEKKFVKTADLNYRNGKSERVFEVLPNFYTKIMNNKYEEIIKSFRRRSISPSKIEMLSLVKNSTTEDLIKQKLKSKGSTFNFSNNEALNNYLKSKKGKLLFVLGHIEDTKFITRDAKNKVLFEIELSELFSIAKSNDVEIFPYGCNSVLDGDYATAGIANEINSIDAVNKFHKARNSSSLEELLGKLAGDDDMVVVSENFYKHEFGNIYKIDIVPRLYSTAIITGGVGTSSALYLMDDSGHSKNIWIYLGYGGIIIFLGYGFYFIAKQHKIRNVA